MAACLVVDRAKGWAIHLNMLSVIILRQTHTKWAQISIVTQLVTSQQNHVTHARSLVANNQGNEH